MRSDSCIGVLFRLVDRSAYALVADTKRSCKDTSNNSVFDVFNNSGKHYFKFITLWVTDNNIFRQGTMKLLS